MNDSVLGTAEQFKVTGPARVCFNEGGVDLLPGETAYLDYLGIHSAAVRLVAASGTAKVSEGDIFAPPRRRGKALVGFGSPLRRFGKRYGLYGRSSGYDHGRDRLLIWVDGAGPPVAAAPLLRRVMVDVAGKASCTRRFVYGMFFD